MHLTETDAVAADALREVGNIAFSHAATALSTLVNRRVDLSIPSVRAVDKAEIETQIAQRNESLYIVSFRLAGDHRGTIAVLFPQTDAIRLLEILHGRPVDRVLDAEGESVLSEIGNIMAGGALLAMNHMLGTTLLHSIPAFHRHLAGEALREAFSGPIVLVVEAEFTVEDRRARGTMIISPREPRPILALLGVHVEARP